MDAQSSHNEALVENQVSDTVCCLPALQPAPQHRTINLTTLPVSEKRVLTKQSPDKKIAGIQCKSNRGLCVNLCNFIRSIFAYLSKQHLATRKVSGRRPPSAE